MFKTSGLVREVGRRLFNCKVTCEVLKITEDIASVIEGVAGESFKEYVQFELHIFHPKPEMTDGVSALSIESAAAGE